MSLTLLLYAAILLLLIAGLWGAYRVLGTPSRLTPSDYAFVLGDLLQSASRAAAQLRAALDAAPDPAALEQVAASTRKIFQTGYYQTLRLRPAQGPDHEAAAREALGRACEAYDWASRMVESESRANPAIIEAARRLIEAGDRELTAAREGLAPDSRAPESTGP